MYSQHTPQPKDLNRYLDSAKNKALLTKFLCVKNGSKLQEVEDLCAILPALHALIGCDTTSGMFSVGKIKRLKRVHQNQTKTSHLDLLASSIQITDKTERAVNTMVCNLSDRQYKGQDSMSLATNYSAGSNL